MHELFFVYSPKKSVPLGLVGSWFMIPDHQNHGATKTPLHHIWTRLHWHVVYLGCDMIRVIVIAFFTLLLLSPPCSLKCLNAWTVSKYKTRDCCWKKASNTRSTARRILSILTCISPRPDLDTRLPVASKYSIWCDMLVLLDMDCNKVAVKVETILQWGKNLQQLWKIDHKFEDLSQRQVFA